MKNSYDSDWWISTIGDDIYLTKYHYRQERRIKFEKDHEDILNKLCFIKVYFIGNFKFNYSGIVKFYRYSDMRKWLDQNIYNKKGNRWRYGNIIGRKNNLFPIYFENKEDALRFKMMWC